MPMSFYLTICRKCLPALAATLAFTIVALIAPAIAHSDEPATIEQPTTVADSLVYTFGFGSSSNTTCSNLDGADPKGSLTFANGFLFGRTFTTTTKGNGDGIIFHVAPNGSGYTIDHLFTGTKPDGSEPLHNAMTLNGSVLYGTTLIGGQHDNGTIFSINDDGTGYSELYSFDKSALKNNGDMPASTFALSGGGVLFGMTSEGGHINGPVGNGTIFSFDPSTSSYIRLHSFGGIKGGSDPHGQPIFDPTGAILYGMTQTGGKHNVGIVYSFKLGTCSPLTMCSGTLATLHTFTCPHGAEPGCMSNGDGASPDHGTLVQSGTKLFGLTTAGGQNGAGIIFSFNVSKMRFTVMHSFGGSTNDGENPFGSLLLDGSTLYGTTRAGGSKGLGTVFQINTDGTGYARVHDFQGGNSDGANPVDDVILVNNTLYGMTEAGGKCNNGVIFSIALP